MPRSSSLRAARLAKECTARPLAPYQSLGIYRSLFGLKTPAGSLVNWPLALLARKASTLAQVQGATPPTLTAARKQHEHADIQGSTAEYHGCCHTDGVEF